MLVIPHEHAAADTETNNVEAAMQTAAALSHGRGRQQQVHVVATAGNGRPELCPWYGVDPLRGLSSTQLAQRDSIAFSKQYAKVQR